MEALELRDAYLDAGVLSDKWRSDALHVALATIARADALVSWNFRHLVSVDKIRLFNVVNLGAGYGLITILPPSGVQTDEID